MTRKYKPDWQEMGKEIWKRIEENPDLLFEKDLEEEKVEELLSNI